MRSIKNFLAIFVLLLAAFSLFVVSADSKKVPLIKSVNVISNDGSSLVVELTGKNFGHDANTVMAMARDQYTSEEQLGIKGAILDVTPKKVRVQFTVKELCGGTLALKTYVNRSASNAVTITYKPSAPVLTNLTPANGEAGAIMQMTGYNFSCDPVANTVSFNNKLAEVLSIQGDTITVRVPQLDAGPATVKVSVNGQSSSPRVFNVDGKPDTSGTITPPTTVQFISNGPLGAAGFAPLFSVKGSFLNYDDGQSTMFDGNVYGTHVAIINVPWRTTTGAQQTAILQINCGHSNSLVGNYQHTFEEFVYMRVNFPKDPTKPYDQFTNPYWWGASAIATEHLPNGGIYYNSVAEATGGVDSFTMSKLTPGTARLGMTMRLVSPDLGAYEDYGSNYEKAGHGIVSIPKAMTVSVRFDQIDVRIPAARYNVGAVTFTDVSGQNGSITTPAARFESNVISVNGQPQLN